MTRKYMSCHELSSVLNCTVAISADSEEELLAASVQHAVAGHHLRDTPELRDQLRKSFREGVPPSQEFAEETPAYLVQELEDDE
jgi:predicted small metal-binding protein